MLSLRLSAPLGISLLLSACSLSMSRQEQAQHILSVPSLATSETIAFQDPAFVQAQWPTASWWQQYGSCELNTLIEEALEKKPDNSGDPRAGHRSKKCQYNRPFKAFATCEF